MLTWAILDFETISYQDVTEVGAYRYAQDPTTEIICAGYRQQGSKTALWKPGDDLSALRALASDDSITLVAFNAAFERAIWREILVLRYGLHDIPLERWHDIQASAALKGLPQNLEDVARILELVAQKDAEGSKVAKNLSKFDKAGNLNLSPELLEQTYAYCKQDVDTEYAAHERLGFLPPGERKSWLATSRINDRGIGLDLSYVRAAKQIVAQTTPALVEEFKAITGYTPTQVKKVMEWLHQNGADLPNLRKETLLAAVGAAIDGETDDEGSMASREVDGAVLADHVVRALRIRQLVGSSSIAKLDTMEACVNADGRARGMSRWHGTGPGRNSSYLLQTQNFPKPTLKADDKIIDSSHVVAAIMSGNAEYVNMTIGPPIETVAGGLRHALQAAPGHKYISGDYAGIQARLVLAVAGQTDKCAMMAAGQDVYIDMGSRIFGRPIDKNKDPWERGIGKNTVLGCGFQMGANTFDLKYVAPFKESRDRFATDEERLAFCQQVIQAYRKEWAPQVPFVWYGLDDAVVRTVWTGKPTEAYGVLYQIEDQWLTARLPSGRKIWYYCPEKHWNAKFDRENPKQAVTYWALKNGFMIRTPMFGGKNTENVIMGMEADLMRDAIDKCEANGLPVVLDVHDEIVVEPETKSADEKMLKQIMLDIPDWAKKLHVPINIDTWTGDRYRK